MSRLFLLVAIAAVVYLLLKSYRRNAPRPDSPAEDMVRCVHCGVHLPKSESILTDGQFFCSKEHRDAYQK